MTHSDRGTQNARLPSGFTPTVGATTTPVWVSASAVLGLILGVVGVCAALTGLLAPEGFALGAAGTLLGVAGVADGVGGATASVGCERSSSSSAATLPPTSARPNTTMPA
ncbi:MAG TPA: hypothetical protein VFB74_27695 [Kribbellaceae bacterium]|nr:hypothetical protein [Kribbellaceae bacterium]